MTTGTGTRSRTGPHGTGTPCAGSTASGIRGTRGTRSRTRTRNSRGSRTARRTAGTTTSRTARRGRRSSGRTSRTGSSTSSSHWQTSSRRRTTTRCGRTGPTRRSSPLAGAVTGTAASGGPRGPACVRRRGPARRGFSLVTPGPGGGHVFPGGPWSDTGARMWDSESRDDEKFYEEREFSEMVSTHRYSWSPAPHTVGCPPSRSWTQGHSSQSWEERDGVWGSDTYSCPRKPTTPVSLPARRTRSPRSTPGTPGLQMG